MQNPSAALFNRCLQPALDVRTTQAQSLSQFHVTSQNTNAKIHY